MMVWIVFWGRNSRVVMKEKIVLALCAVLAMAGCNQNCKDRGECECMTRYDCAEGQRCLLGACVADEQDVWIIPERRFGEPCISHGECVDGVCLPMGPDNGGVCTRACDGAGCEDGWACKAWSGNGASEVTAVCVPETAGRLCTSCAVDGHCNASGDLCMDLGGDDGHVCALDCTFSECPVGYECQDVRRDDRIYRQCVPKDGNCECGAGKEGMGRACTNGNEFGVCSGWEYCERHGNEYRWGECGAKVPAQEVCNGVDDDCDGLVDGLDPGIAFTGEGGDAFPLCFLGGCVGRWICDDAAGSFGWRCDAGDPEREVCNGVDDNCNGDVDEAFVNADGLYVHDDNCGACGVSCSSLLADLAVDAEGNVVPGAAGCEVRDGAPVCVPRHCAPGYYPYPHDNPVSCLRLESPSCEVCGADSDCRVYSDRCMPLRGDFGMHCLQSCDRNAPYEGCTGETGVRGCCPEGSVCRDYEGGKFCVPLGESCSCDASKDGMTRNCVVESGTGVCQGRQTCQKNAAGHYAWSECSAETLTVEVCDGQDNNCDGQIDELFRDEQGRYNDERHCGACNEDCPSRWKAPELHAEGACLISGDAYSCQFTACKYENVPFGKACTTDRECPSGQRCDRQVYYCTAGDGASCSADADCASLGSAHRCEGGKCVLHVQYHDLNGVAADGCECGQAVDAGTDMPDSFSSWPTADSVYVDRNCDGIDGDVKTSLFVSSQSTQSEGTLEHPYRTIGEAVRAYNPSVHTAILVAGGTYYEQVQMRSGVRLYGGYSADFRTRSVIQYSTQIVAPPPAADGKPGSVYIPACSRRTVLSGFVIRGYDTAGGVGATGTQGANTYALYLERASSTLVISNNQIVAGRAASGGNGATGASGSDGSDGGRGRDSRECGTTHCYGETTRGGDAGRNASCPAADGHPGATARDGSQRQEYYSEGYDGRGGTNPSYSNASNWEEFGSFCKYDCMAASEGMRSGGDGRNGDDGAVGLGGAGCVDAVGHVVNGEWVGNAGGNGGAGGTAIGGGGGGAGGGAVNQNDSSCTEGNLVGDIGGSGGGGGAGGCGGAGGHGGGAGGGAFAIWIADHDAMPNIYGNQIRLGLGGAGGNGGAGGAGGNGGIGGAGGASVAPAWCAGEGGSGGSGGTGGAGGGGGGGCGGVSIGIAGVDIPANIGSNNAFILPEDDQNKAAGSPGSGGSSPAGGKGGDGAQGLVEFIHSF